MRHFEKSANIKASPQEIFEYADNHANFSAHMSKSSWMMAGGKMETQVDEGKGQKVGSHIRLKGKILGINLYLDEFVTVHEHPFRKAWQTVGDLSLLVIGHYKMGLEINPENNESKFKVYIDYELPGSFRTRWLGYLFGRIYAKWCVNQMLQDTYKHFSQN
ncbi:MAG: hypothetical protein UT45_C0001G0084 [Candidatus Daviesbacteria bacterium GW2011_GWA2_39_33]|nr:MAG: hypothetical protein UT45_C0001G0084 [Candidatus Daviesbacteria bacterium GW2011_GWA2_39_33]